MKWIGALLIVVTSALFGIDISYHLRSRTKQLRELLKSIQMLEAEMIYGNYALQTIFRHIQARTDGPIAQFYDRLANRLSEVVEHFPIVWEDEVERLTSDSSLHKNEIEIIKQLGKNIGSHHIKEQKNHLQLVIHYLSQQLDDALLQEKRYEKTTRSLGILVGVLIVLILI